MLRPFRARRKHADPDFVIRLRPVRDALGRPVVIRLRQLLKRALRDWALRCVEITEGAP